jgi:hypothetical protein
MGSFDIISIDPLSISLLKTLLGAEIDKFMPLKGEIALDKWEGLAPGYA